jgi:hypothetical protein
LTKQYKLKSGFNSLLTSCWLSGSHEAPSKAGTCEPNFRGCRGGVSAVTIEVAAACRHGQQRGRGPDRDRGTRPASRRVNPGTSVTVVRPAALVGDALDTLLTTASPRLSGTREGVTRPRPSSGNGYGCLYPATAQPRRRVVQEPLTVKRLVSNHLSQAFRMIAFACYRPLRGAMRDVWAMRLVCRTAVTVIWSHTRALPRPYPG